MSVVGDSCNLCGANSAKVIRVDSGYKICRCQQCSLIYVSPRPQLQADEDVNFHESSAVAEEPSFRDDKERVYAAGLERLGQLIPGKGRILDVGCGFGTFLTQAREKGWDPYGIDVSEVSVSYAVNTLHLENVARRELLGSAFPVGYFSAATMWNVLEHVPDPCVTLEEVRRILRPEAGAVLVRVPNMVVHHALWAAEPVLRPILKRLGRKMQPYLGGISPPQHLYGFTPATLKAIIEKAGFDHVSVVPTVPHDAQLPLGRLVLAIGRMAHAVSRGRVVLTPAMVAYGRVPR